MAINLDHVTEQITVTDTATNASLTVQPKGTGAFNIAAGSSGVNLSNGGTVTALTLVNTGGSYTTLPTVTIAVPTTAGGVQATANPRLFATAATVQTGGTGYTLNDVVTIVGGTPVSASATFTVTGVSGGAITSLSPLNYGTYTAVPTNPVSITGGTGSSATLNPSYGVISFVITNAGSGYVEQPTVTITGGGGAAATAYATVGSPPIIRSLAGSGSGAQSLSFYGSSGEALRLNTSTTSLPAINYAYVAPGAQNNGIQIGSQGADTNVWLGLTTKGTGNVQFLTGGGNNEQVRIAHTASAVNYVNATGAATGSGPTISAQGSDTNADLNLTTKGTGAVRFNTGSGEQVRIVNSTTSDYWVMQGNPTILYPDGTSANRNAALSSKGTSAVQLYTNGGNQLQLNVSHTASAVNYVELTGAQIANAPTISSKGSDTNISFAYSSKGTGGHDFYTAGTSFARQLTIAHTASAVNYVQVTGNNTTNSPVISVQGSDTNIGVVVSSKGNARIGFFTNNVSTQQFVINHTASAVNYLQVTGGATGVAPVLSAAGSDTNIPAVVQPKGTGALQAQQTDSTATGGNARGANAVDFQTARGTAAQVANGTLAVITGGQNNTASGLLTTVSGGFNNTSSGNSAFVGGGQYNVASELRSVAVGGGVNTSAGIYNFVGGGFTNSGTSGSAVTTQSATMNGTTAVTLSGSNANIKVGQYISGTSIAADTYVAAISGTSLTLSQAASGSSTSTLGFYTPHGVVVGGGNNQATGSYSFIGGGGDAGTAGNRNVASGDWSFVGGGVKNVASGRGSFIGGGGIDAGSNIGGNVASGVASVLCGGRQNVASGEESIVMGGAASTANGLSSMVQGRTSTTRGITGNVVFAGSYSPISGGGSSQLAFLVLARQTTDATPIVLTNDGTAAGTTNQVIMPNNSAYFFTGEVVAGVTGGGNTKGWKIEGVIKRGANAASTALVGTPTVTSSYADAGASTWVIAVTADTTNGGLAVTFTGQASTTIRTVAQIRTTEMTF